MSIDGIIDQLVTRASESEVECFGTVARSRQTDARGHPGDACAQGFMYGVAQGYRSIAEQNRLYAQGRTLPGPIVTNARGGQSNHNRGIAVEPFNIPKTVHKRCFETTKAFKRLLLR